MKYIKKIYESVLDDHKGIISKIKELDYILEDESCRLGYFTPGWSLNGFWIKVITKEKVANYREGYTVGDLNRDVKNLYLPYIDEYANRVKELCDSSGYSFDLDTDVSRGSLGSIDMNDPNKKEKMNVTRYWIFYFKIWVPSGPKETPSYLKYSHRHLR